ncbi:MAG: 4Fe-4S binding protein [Limnochordaceae bacterium]|uniref:4Fe-4S binding protein n=1 Tax=Carboxydichorda subterranea TaxID=3109565 RepID=A0ABZ1BUE7_9FIRM|nr:4Fe-4S binding protein [Limnochorda sp. L945t]MBE3597387.1 4Fe-4S binding protein [Limnochordaceae bacterium]WRP16436.1 4Fe-4S binding protein [Limnochorda sp. L945t]
MAHYITDKCIGCTACVNVCPVDCITGQRDHLHVIDAGQCIDCHACAYICPVEAIVDRWGRTIPRIKKRADWPKPVIDPVLCSGCNFCVDVCPESCLSLEGGGPFEGVAVLADPKACVGCGLCEDVCAKGAIVVPPPKVLEEAGIPA